MDGTKILYSFGATLSKTVDLACLPHLRKSILGHSVLARRQGEFLTAFQPFHFLACELDCQKSHLRFMFSNSANSTVFRICIVLAFFLRYLPFLESALLVTDGFLCKVYRFAM